MVLFWRCACTDVGTKEQEVRKMGKISVFRRNGGDKQGRSQLYVVVYISRETIRLATGVKVLESEWDAERELVRGKGSSDKNLIIGQMRSKVNDILVKARLRDERLTKESFRRYWDCPSEFDSFLDYMNHYYKKVQRVKEDNTLSTYRTVMRVLRDFAPGLTFREIDYDFGMRLLAHLRRGGKKESTAYKNLAVFKVFVEAAKRDGYIERTTFDQIRIRKQKSEVVYLDECELRRMVELYDHGGNGLTEAQRYVLGFWLFMAFTSPHVGDARAVTMSQLRHGELRYQRKKTRKDVVVPLSARALRLVDDYRRGRREGVLFDRLPSDQKVNARLKEIAAIAGIGKRLTCKTARHTFATFFYRHNKDPFALKELLGHSDLKDTLVYTHIVDEQIREGMRAFDEL